MKRNILLNPGPATTTDTVKNAQVVPDICPREKEFGEVMEFVSKELTNLVADNDEYTTVLFGGSGTAAVESMISSVVDKDILLIINNGAYGKRICEMAEIYDLNFIEFIGSPVNGIDFIKLEQIISEYNTKKRFIKNKLNDYKGIVGRYNIKNEDDEIKVISHIAVIHHETTTGILNDIHRVGGLCSKYNIDLIVDGISSFAGIPIDMKSSNIKCLASSSNKCIQGMAGVSFVIAEKELLINTKRIKPRNLYLNLYNQYEYFQKNYQMRFTPPVQVLYALKQAIIETKAETIERRYERYVRCCEILWDGLEKLNLKLLVPKEKSSMLLTSIVEPEVKGYNFDSLHNYLYEKGFTIYPGKVSSKNTFRIANIGDIYPENMRKFIEILEEYFLSIK
ncbi:aminotransferase class V-fold PLP-dependent enzyme [Clostridium butyricum]|uniref:aminotransferase class V-fold PLP-dependent enzyme n=1 Tax=Clostridium butyricum TaxID=1492 RepID=UPI0005C14431|nr:aminotransferase class V-fold PLP-dependent enzyme [Clostridium butyricum]KIU06884.1 2-aminoethylphosphonate transport [Clostridium butyricum]MBA8966719.1 2-aminoethylphosphonate-pyruvate transaminase [Clostridium butyricum]MBA8972216.1 2-aminoethylphosphonate-pyruvate transaminase [Clostridium butyricum]MBC2426766.1 aminotransferase class V-fold PLP-dependent enzyme [Clostridium butyricum]MDU5104627.1 aminotransferase class V-fold PLP-dependent enzyme [Clostridium butyricum]